MGMLGKGGQFPYATPADRDSIQSEQVALL